MFKTYRIVQQWNEWLTQFLGMAVNKTEQHYLCTQFSNKVGCHALLIGVPHQYLLLEALNIDERVLLGPLINKNKDILYIESNFKELPIASGSIDLLILPHSLEFLDNPRQLLNEACRVVKPEGHIIIFGFNPYSLWGLARWWSHHKKVPWSGNYLKAEKVKQWLVLADFQLISDNRIMFRPPTKKSYLFNHLGFFEWLGRRMNAFFGGIYVITAKAKVIPLTPIKLHWKQQLPPFLTTMPGPTMRDRL